MVALHETVIDGDDMAMRRVTDGVAIPASHTLSPHLSRRRRERCVDVTRGA